MIQTLKHALISSVLMLILVFPIFGIQITREGLDYSVHVEWTTIIIAVTIVFVFQLIRPTLAPRLKDLASHIPSLPTIPNKAQAWVMAGVVLIAFILPSFAGRSTIDIATLALIYIILGLGLNIVVGYAGLLDLGFVGFYAVGAYTYAMLNKFFGFGFWEALPIAGGFAALFGFILGFPVLRLRGDYLAIVTLGFGEIIRLLLINLVDITGGSDGINSISKPTVFGLEMARRSSDPDGTTFHQFMGWEFSTTDMVIYIYLIALCLALLTFAISNRLIRMPIGRAWEALREDEIACRSLGLNPTSIKLSAFTLGAFFAGIGGALFAAKQGSVNPASFEFIESALILAIVVFGGMGSQVGVIIAAIFVTVVPELARSFQEYRMLVFGLVMVLMMMWRPQGLLPTKRKHVELPKS